MSKRTEHTFQFTADRIAGAALTEAMYHEDRLEHWKVRAVDALSTVKETIGAKVIEREQTNGTVADVVVDYGDAEAWREYQQASNKIVRHRAEADRFRTDEQVYGTQDPSRIYELDTDDVHHFRLGGQERED